MKGTRLNAYLALVGVASRRKADQMIAAGRISIDGKVVRTLGTRIENPRKHEIALDGVPLDRAPKRFSYYLLYKPPQVVTTLKDPEGRRSIREFLPPTERVYPVGRLDYDAEGLLLLTNDGQLTNELTHPRYGVKKTYLVKVKGRPSGEVLMKLRKGVRLEDGFAKPDEVEFDHSTKMNDWFRVTVSEGRNRLIKRLWLRVGHPVVKLRRVSFGTLKLGSMKPGDIRRLTPDEVRRLSSATSS